MSIQAIVWALNTRVGDPTLKVILVALANYANVDNQLWHRQDRISHDTEIPVRTLRRRMGQLVERGLITIEERRDDEGRKMSSLVTVLMDAGDIQRPLVAGGPSAKTGGQPAATKVAGQESKSNRKEDSTYAEEFEALWKLYPRTKNTSKKKAHDLWRVLSAENQERVRVAVPIFAADMKREGRPEDKIKHFQFFLSERVYETVSAAAPAAKAAAVDWHKTAKPEQWAKVLVIWRGDSNWRQSWGPEPGKPGCMVPDDLLTESEKHWISQSRVPRKPAQAAE